MSEKLIARVLSKSTQCGDCLLWKGAISAATNAPAVWFDGKVLNARRALWEAMGKKHRDGFTIKAKCKEACCVAPEHLVQVKPVKAGAKGIAHRAKIAASARARTSKLDQAKADDIRFSGEPPSVMARKYGITIQSAVEIQKGRRWAPIASPFAGLGARA